VGGKTTVEKIATNIGQKSKVRFSYGDIVDYLKTILSLMFVAGLSTSLKLYFDITDIALLYILPVLLSAVLWGQGPSIFASIVGVLTYDYFIVDPTFGFVPNRKEDFLLLAIFLIVAFVTSKMATRLRKESAYNKSLIKAITTPFAVMDINNHIIDLNAATESITGCSREEMIGTDFCSYFEEPDKARQAYKMVLKKGTISNYELGLRHKNGHTTTVLFSGYTYNNERNEYAGVFIVTRDITYLKKTETKLKQSSAQLRALSIRLQKAREDERAVLARDIHDELGQALTGLKIRLAYLSKNNFNDRESLNNEIEHMDMLLDDTIRSVRKISSQLRPSVLDDLGLVAGIEWLINDFKEKTGISCRFSSDIDDSYLGKDLSTALFRILQEALTNIIRHAKATKVTVDIMDDAGFVVLTVEDNGRGITDKEASSSKSLGLLGMHERARSFKGMVAISGRNGRGTLLNVAIPYKKQRRKEYVQDSDSRRPPHSKTGFETDSE
jgi:PAS domain S-box-containing protein